MNDFTVSIDADEECICLGVAPEPMEAIAVPVRLTYAQAAALAHQLGSAAVDLKRKIQVKLVAEQMNHMREKYDPGRRPPSPDAGDTPESEATDGDRG